MPKIGKTQFFKQLSGDELDVEEIKEKFKKSKKHYKYGLYLINKMLEEDPNILDKMAGKYEMEYLKRNKENKKI